MRYGLVIILLAFVVFISGCQAIKEVSDASGTIIGSSIGSTAGVTEKGAQAYGGVGEEENPFNR